MTRRTVTVLVGTDHHAFDRLVSWADRWAAAHPEDDVLVQHGASGAPTTAQGRDIMPPAELRDRCARSDIVVTHGGPGTIMDARAAGHRPIVLPREPARGEHVDDHQLRFSTWAAGKQLITRVADVPQLDARVVGCGVAGTRDSSGATHDTEQTAARVEQLVARRRTGRSSASPGATTTVYIGGWGRSGSTLLECLLARLDDVVVLGEVTHLWERGIQRDELCACGQHFSACPFWIEVGKHAFGGWEQVDIEHLLTLKAAVDRQRRMPSTARRHTSAPLRRKILDYAEHYRRVYDAAIEVSGASVVVDSSKDVPTALTLSHHRDIDLRVLHMVRDSRGVAYSWSKVVPRPESSGEDTMPQFTAAWSTTMWLSLNTAISGLRHRGVPVAQVRYEDLATDAASTVRSAWQTLGLPGSGELPMLDACTIELRPTHSVAGNPMRFRTGLTTLRQDTEWRSAMSARDRRLVTLMSYPMLRRLGYRGK